MLNFLNVILHLYKFSVNFERIKCRSHLYRHRTINIRLWRWVDIFDVYIEYSSLSSHCLVYNINFSSRVTIYLRTWYFCSFCFPRVTRWLLIQSSFRTSFDSFRSDSSIFFTLPIFAQQRTIVEYLIFVCEPVFRIIWRGLFSIVSIKISLVTISSLLHLTWYPMAYHKLWILRDDVERVTH